MMDPPNGQLREKYSIDFNSNNLWQQVWVGCCWHTNDEVHLLAPCVSWGGGMVTKVCIENHVRSMIAWVSYIGAKIVVCVFI